MLFKIAPITLLASVALGHANAGLHARHAGHGSKNITSPVAGHHKFNGTKPDFPIKNGTDTDSTTTSTITTTATHTATVTVVPTASDVVGGTPGKAVGGGGACKSPVTIYKDVYVTETAGAAPSVPVKAPIGGGSPAPGSGAAPSAPAGGATPGTGAAPSYGAGPKNPPPKNSAPFPVSNGTASYMPVAPTAPAAPLVTDPAIASPSTFATIASSSSYEAWPLSPAISEAPAPSSAQPPFVEPSGSWLESYASESTPASASATDSVVVLYETVNVLPVPVASAPARRARAVRKRV